MSGDQLGRFGLRAGKRAERTHAVPVRGIGRMRGIHGRNYIRGETGSCGPPIQFQAKGVLLDLSACVVPLPRNLSRGVGARALEGCFARRTARWSSLPTRGRLRHCSCVAGSSPHAHSAALFVIDRCSDDPAQETSVPDRHVSARIASRRKSDVQPRANHNGGTAHGDTETPARQHSLRKPGIPLIAEEPPCSDDRRTGDSQKSSSPAE